MSKMDGAYYQRRAEEEVELAQRATDPAAVQVHYALTEFYLEKVHGAASGTASPVPAGARILARPPARRRRVPAS